MRFLLPASLLLSFNSLAPAQVTTFASADQSGMNLQGAVGPVDVSANGRYVFFRHTLPLIPNFTNNGNLYRFDRRNQALEIVSLDSAGQDISAPIETPSMSANGGVFVFRTSASLIPTDTDTNPDIYVIDIRPATPVNSRILNLTFGATNPAGSLASHARPSVSGDGRLIAFDSDASSLAPNDTNNRRDVFLVDRDPDCNGNPYDTAPGISLVSVSSTGAQGNRDSLSPSVSEDGSFVAFESWATNFANVDTNGGRDVFLALRSQCGAILQPGTLLVSRRPGVTSGQEVTGTGESRRPQISGNGRFVVFQSSAEDLVLGDSNAQVDIFRFDRQTLGVDLVSLSDTGAQAQGQDCINASVSHDGTKIAFESLASNLVQNDTNTARDVFRVDTGTGSISRYSVKTGGGQSNGGGELATISADGRFVSFRSTSDDLDPGDATTDLDAYVHGAALTLESPVTTITPGTSIDLDVYVGTPNAPVGLFLDAINGQPVSLLLGTTQFDNDGLATLPFMPPSGLPTGTTLELRAFGISPPNGMATGSDTLTLVYP